MVLKKSTPNKVLKYRVNYENENTRLLILDAVKNRNASINIIGDETEISEEIALFIWHHSGKERTFSITINYLEDRMVS